MEENAKPGTVDFRVIRYKGLNKIITTGWSTLVSVLMVPFYILAIIESSGANRFIVLVFFPFGVVVAAVVSAQVVVLITFVGLRLNKYVFRKNL